MRQSLPDNFFRLCINSNDMYSRWLYPNNNCYDFMIEFLQGSAESIQYRISQCNRYQVTELRLPIEGNKGVQLDYRQEQQTFYSQVIKSMSFPPTTTSQKAATPSCYFLTKLTDTQYRHMHEELEKLCSVIRFPSFNHQEVTTKENFIRKLPPMIRYNGI